MDLTLKVLILMCLQAIIGFFVSVFINETIGATIVCLAAAVNVLILVFAIVKFYKSYLKGGLEKECF